MTLGLTALHTSDLFDKNVINRIMPYLAKYLAIEKIDLDLIERSIRRAVRLGVFRRLDSSERAFLLALRRWLSKGFALKSRVVIEIAKTILVKIEMFSLRGRAIALGILISLKRGFTEILRDAKKLLVVGLQFLYTPILYRVI